MRQARKPHNPRQEHQQDQPMVRRSRKSRKARHFSGDTGRNVKNRRMLIQIAAGLLFLLALAGTVLLARKVISGTSETAASSEIAQTETETAAAVKETEAPRTTYVYHEVIPLETLHINSPEDNLPNNTGYSESEREFQIYSYVQAPGWYYEGDSKWAGDWCYIKAAGREFIYWGCGICCLSNIYSTFQAKPVLPDVVYEWTREKTTYNPDSGVGAVSWSELKTMCTEYGMEARLCTKPKEYSEFQKDIWQSDAAIVLVCKDNDGTLWDYTSGHYVNLWEYDPETDTVFLSDASGLHNRARVSLRDIYNALKTASSAQYMIVFPD